MWYGGDTGSRVTLDSMVAYSMAYQLALKHRSSSYNHILNNIKELPNNCSRERFAAMIRYIALKENNDE